MDNIKEIMVNELREKEESPQFLERYAVKDDDLKEIEGFGVPLIGRVIVTGEISVIYAAANTGKTLMVLKLLEESIKNGLIDPRNVWYVNVDDSPAGIKEKNVFVGQAKFRMLAEGRNSFGSSNFVNILETMVATPGASEGQIMVLDTLKKCVDLMSKTESTAFVKLLRRFNDLGGTVVALAHTNKHRGVDGHEIYSGTSDVFTDVDNVTYLTEISFNTKTMRRTVQFNVRKRRSNVALQETYEYSHGEGLTYLERLNSVHMLTEAAIERHRRDQQRVADEDLIAEIRFTINAGKTDKTSLLKETRVRADVPRKLVEDVLLRYEGKDFGPPLWRFERGPNGRKTYSLLSGVTPQHAEF